MIEVQLRFITVIAQSNTIYFSHLNELNEWNGMNPLFALVESPKELLNGVLNAVS